MLKTVKFPALMAALPPKARNPRIAVCAFDTTIEIPEVSTQSMPVALLIKDIGDRMIEYRLHEGRLYKSTWMSPETLLLRHEQHVLDSRDHNLMTGKIMRDMRRAVAHVEDLREDKFWPANARYLLKSGMSAEMGLNAPILTATVDLQIDGKWLEAAKNTPHLEFLLDEHPSVRLARYERMTQARFAELRIVDGAVWVPAREPCFVVQMYQGGFGHCVIGDTSRYDITADNAENTSSWYNDLQRRALSIAERATVARNLPDYYRPVAEVEIHIPEALTFDFAAMELDRCARVLRDTFETNLSSRMSNAFRSTYKLPSTPLIAAYTDLHTLVDQYDPFEGIPDEVEDVMETFVSAVEASASDSDLIPQPIVDYAKTYLDNWRDRTVDMGDLALDGRQGATP